MPKRSSRRAASNKSKPTVDKGSIDAWVRRYLDWMRVHNYAQRSIENNEGQLARFTEWCSTRSLATPQEITKAMLDTYQRHLFHARQERNGKPLSFRSQQAALVAVRVFFRWLVKENVLLFNPASELELPKVEKRLPKHLLTAAEVEAVLDQADVHTTLGLRDRAIMETFYSTGMRRAELISLSVYAVDFDRAVVTIRQGKGRKDRVVPIGARALAWIRKYLDDARPELVVEPDDGVLFITNMGEPFTSSRMSQLVTDYVNQAGLNKKGSCHLFRHCAATLMLENGADIRMIQAMLGHQELRSTQIYTQVSIKKLQEVHALTHPSAGLEKGLQVRGDGGEKE